MTQEENALWEKILTFKLDEEHSSLKFSDRLARENGWTKPYTLQVIEEYKKFIFLCCITKTGVTPSDQVDQVWHLHLTYTKSYWIDLCKNTINREIHHTPTRGGDSESEKFNDFYSETLLKYTEKFSHEAPGNIWPQNEKRFSDIDFQRINLKNYWLMRKPKLKGTQILFFLLLMAVPFYVHAGNSDDGTGTMAITFIVILVIIIAFNSTSNKKRDGDSGGGGCGGDSGCSNGHHSHGSDSDSGCSSSGCSGCGGGCGGD